MDNYGNKSKPHSFLKNTKEETFEKWNQEKKYLFWEFRD